MVTVYPERGSWWTVDAMLRDVRKRILVQVVGGGHGTVVFEHRGKRLGCDVWNWNGIMCPIRKEKRNGKGS